MIWATILSWGARAIPFLKSPKVVGSMVGVIAAGLLYLYVGHLQDKVADLQADNKLFIRYLDECQTANVENQKSVRLLRRANELLANSVEVKEDERIAAIEAAAARELEAKLQLDDTLDTLQDLQNESLSCNELMEIDLGAVCPLTNERLREHASGTISQD
jgi:hypothetical protein